MTDSTEDDGGPFDDGDPLDDDEDYPQKKENKAASPCRQQNYIASVWFDASKRAEQDVLRATATVPGGRGIMESIEDYVKRSRVLQDEALARYRIAQHELNRAQCQSVLPHVSLHGTDKCVHCGVNLESPGISSSDHCLAREIR